MSNDNQGTPKLMREAVTNALCVGPLSGVTDRVYWAVRDFIAQRFGAAMLDASKSPEMVEALDKLFKEIVRDTKFSNESKES